MAALASLEELRTPCVSLLGEEFWKLAPAVSQMLPPHLFFAESALGSYAAIIVTLSTTMSTFCRSS